MIRFLWNQVFERFKSTAEELNHERGMKLTQMIEQIPEEVIDYVIKNYTRRMSMINGIYFFAERIKTEKESCSAIECSMQIFNLQRHLKIGTRRNDMRDLIFKENLEIAQMSDDEISQYWFWKSPEDLAK